MKIRSAIYVVVAFGVIAVVALTVYARSMAPHPTREQVADTWIGFTQDDLKLFRLSLDADGGGICGYTFVREPAKLYLVDGWTLSGYAIEINLIPVDQDAESIWMKGTTTGHRLNLEIGGNNLRWNRKLTMYRESEVTERREKIRHRMESYSAD
jgi:hypothetical protein